MQGKECNRSMQLLIHQTTMNTDSLEQKLPEIILCGYERGGTTLLSEIFRNNGYQSGFECGVLLAQSPCEFKEVHPFYERILNDWKISKHELEYATNGNFEHFYDSIISSSPLTCQRRSKTAPCAGARVHHVD